MRRKYLFNALLAVVFCSLCPYATPGEAATAKIKISKEGQACIACHEA